MDLSKKHCVSCKENAASLNIQQIKKYLDKISGWDLRENKRIKKTFKFKNFKKAIDFVNKVAKTAEEEQHHPNIFISYNKVVIELWTHATGRLSENDFILASKIDLL